MYISLCYFNAYYKCYVHFLLSQKKIGDFFVNLWYVNTIHVLARQVACIFCYRAIQTKGKLLFLYRQNNQRRGCYKVGGHYAFYALFVY